MDIIIRNDDGTLTVPVPPDRHAEDDVSPDDPSVAANPTTITLHPGEGGFDAALAEWDLQQHGATPAVSTASGREEAMSVVHHIAEDPDAEIRDVIDDTNDPEASAEALRHVLVGGVHAVEDFANEVAEHEGGDPLPAHEVTKIIGEVLAERDS